MTISRQISRFSLRDARQALLSPHVIDIAMKEGHRYCSLFDEAGFEATLLVIAIRRFLSRPWAAQHAHFAR